MTSETTLITELIRQSTQPVLLICDENWSLDALPSPSSRGGWAITNRWDLLRPLEERGWHTRFCDYQWPDDCPGTLRVIYRVSKEKAVVHHLINLCAERLDPNSELFLLGQKGEGIKTYAKKAQQRLGGARVESKEGKELWQIALTRGTALGAPLDDQNYTELREVAQVNGHRLCSKPGVFGWNKIDQGSALLIEQLPTLLGTELPIGPQRVLDLGCGSGYLCLASCSEQTRITATDNNSAALQVTRTNLTLAGFQAEVEPSNAGDELAGPFEIILCNPPFHSGFGVDHGLTEAFARNAARLLTSDGVACFVVNQHVPLARIASNHFAKVRLIINDSHFCVYSLSQPK